MLLSACGAGQVEIVEFLHSKGANLNVIDKVRPSWEACVGPSCSASSISFNKPRFFE